MIIIIHRLIESKKQGGINGKHMDLSGKGKQILWVDWRWGHRKEKIKLGKGGEMELRKGMWREIARIERN